MKILLFLITFQIILNQRFIYTPQYALYFLNLLPAGKENVHFFKSMLSKTFDDAYVFNEISKNPPNTSFSNNYYKKVDIQKILNDIDEEKNGYIFYQDLKKALFSLEDLHINLDLSVGYNILQNTYFHLPLNLYISKYNNEPRIFGVENKDFYWKYFSNYQNVYEIIEKNKNFPISKINGKNPFDFITDFGKDYLNLKSRQATFFYKFVFFINNNNLYQLPLSIEELINFTVVYDNNETFTTDYLITSYYNYSDIFKSNLFSNNNKQYNIFSKNEAYNYISFNNIESINEKLINKNYNQINNENEIIEWDYSYSESYKCKADHQNKINVNFIGSFGSESIKEPFYKTIIDCVQLFDKNTYPIVLINYANRGGQVFLAQVLLELLSPKVEFHIYSAFRKTETFKNTSELNDYFSLFYNSENCETLNYDYLTKEEHKINYGNNLSSILTEPFFFLGKKEKNEINKIKMNLKNPRNPTDFVVFTDGFSYSSTAIFLKYMQYYGGGITVGYFSHPNVSKSQFDSGLSPSVIFDYLYLQLFSPEGYKQFYQLSQIIFKIPGIQTFYNPENMSVPLEYEFTPVDEIVDIYEVKVSYKYNYDIFVNKSLEIINKYKKECNPNNTKLVLVSKNCDGKFGNKYTHGGYQCGANGKWSDKCVPSYCNIGYIFDHVKNECINDICSDIKQEEEISDDIDDSDGNKTLYYVLFSIIGFIIIIAILLIIFNIHKKKRFKDSYINSIDNINLVEK